MAALQKVDRAIPALPLIAAGYLLPNLDRIGRLLAHEAPAADEPAAEEELTPTA